MSESHGEIHAKQVITDAVSRLDARSRARVLQWMVARWFDTYLEHERKR